MGSAHDDAVDALDLLEAEFGERLTALLLEPGQELALLSVDDSVGVCHNVKVVLPCKWIRRDDAMREKDKQAAVALQVEGGVAYGGGRRAARAQTRLHRSALADWYDAEPPTTKHRLRDGVYTSARPLLLCRSVSSA